MYNLFLPNIKKVFCQEKYRIMSQKKLHFSTIKFIVFESAYILKTKMQLKTNIQHVKKKNKKI